MCGPMHGHHTDRSQSQCHRKLSHTSDKERTPLLPGHGRILFCFCRNFSDVVKPLTDDLRKAVPFVWSALCQVAFDSLKNL